MSEPVPTNSELAEKVVGAVQAVQDAHETLVDGARQLAAHMADKSCHSQGSAIIEGTLDFSDPDAAAEAASGLPVGAIVAYDCCPDCSAAEEVVVGGAFNAREFITESGEWESPVTGTAKVTVIDGGMGAAGSNLTSNSQRVTYAGSGGAIKSGFISLVKGQKVDVVIGAGGQGVTDANNAAKLGGKTKFGDFATTQNSLLVGSDCWYFHDASGTYRNSRSTGGGFGPGSPDTANGNATWYGGGGGAFLYANTISFIGNGYQGAVIIEYYDAAKDKNISVDMAASVTLAELRSQIAALTARVQELENG